MHEQSLTSEYQSPSNRSPLGRETPFTSLLRSIVDFPALHLAIFVLMTALLCHSLTAQISLGGAPRSFSKSVKSFVPTMTMPAVDVASLLREDSLDTEKGVPFRFGFGLDVDYSPNNSGTWDTLSDGGRIWRLTIVSQGAYSINLLYSMYKLPEGADLYIYSAERSMVLGAFTARNNKEHGQFATGLVKGDAVTLEYYEPATAAFPGEVAISRVVHGYRNLFNYDLAKDVLGYGGSGTCNNNVNCPEGMPWQTDKRAVAMVLTGGGSRICSGSMINNVRQDRTPYFLTANHCLGGEATWIIMFNYESPTCVNQNGPVYMTVQGTTRLSNYSTSDFGLLQLTEAPPDSYRVVFAGWNNINDASDSAVGIHHPEGDIKKITFDFGAYTSTDYLGTVVNPTASHWRITDWEDGTTEPGSSGSPLFDKHHHIIGQLHGGYASCSSITSDYYGKFAMSWNGGGTNSTRLKNWLDPDNTGALTLNAFDPYAGVVITHTPLLDTKDSLNPYPIVCTITTDSALIADSLLLYYQLSTIWYKDTLQATGFPGEYQGFIPPQTPGATVNYYLYAQSITGKADTTAIYTFRVIKYAVILLPAIQGLPAAVGDTVMYDLTAINNGLYNDSFNLTLANADWPTQLLDSLGAVPITGTPLLAPAASFEFKVRVIVPPSMFGDIDTAMVVAISVSDGTVTTSATIKTISLGQPISLPFADNFPSTSINVGNWVYSHGATIDSMGIREPSAPLSLRLNGDPSDADTIMSQAIDLSGLSDVKVSFIYERGGGGESPEAGDDLFLEYYNNLGSWSPLKQLLGSGQDMTYYEPVTVDVPPDGYHPGFRIRFRNLADVGAYDDWFVDNVRIDHSPAISVTPLSLNRTVGAGDSTVDHLLISNSGLGGLGYSLVVVADVSPSMQLFDRLLSESRVNPATYPLPAGWIDYPTLKGDQSMRIGPEVVYNAGGPDAFGYAWIDSDEPGGATFNWIDIEATGTNITAGLGDDNFIGPFPIGFSFPFYDMSYTEFYIGSNGIIGFGPTIDYNSFYNPPMPNATTPNNIIAWCWDDLNISESDAPGGKVLYRNVGGNLVIEFARYPEFGSNNMDVITAEMILSPNGDIKLQYSTIASGFDILSNTIGIENMGGTVGLTVSSHTNYLHNGLAVNITKPVDWLFASPSTGEVPSGQTDTVTLKFSAAVLDTGVYTSAIKIYSNDPDSIDNPLVLPAKMTVIPAYMCGDASADNVVNVSDVVYLISFIFSGGPDPSPYVAGDGDCSGVINVSDVVYLLNYIFASGPEPCAACKRR